MCCQCDAICQIFTPSDAGLFLGFPLSLSKVRQNCHLLVPLGKRPMDCCIKYRGFARRGRHVYIHDFAPPLVSFLYDMGKRKSTKHVVTSDLLLSRI